VSLAAAVLPDVAVRPFHLDRASVPGPDDPVDVWHDLVGVVPEQEPAFVLLPDPFSCNAEPLVRKLDEAFPGCAKVGGLASGGRAPGQHRLFAGDKTATEGVAGLVLYGDVIVDTVVAQGCRAVGEPMVVTACTHNLIAQLDGRPATEALDAMFRSLDGTDQRTFRTSPMIGVAIDANKPRPRHGDFLLRNLMGVNRDDGVIAVGVLLEPQAVVQFHVRDRATSSLDLAELLDRHVREGHPARGALMFSCLGRGEGFYGEPDFDSRLVRDRLGPVPTGGFFCNGEIGPVHKETFLHGYTASLALFRPRGWS
jgi:small ligand-binding sensory domain FIST